MTSTSAIEKRYLGKYVEIYLDQAHDTIYYSDCTKERKSLICGNLIEVDDPWIVIEINSDGDKNTVLVNSGWIYTILSPTKHVSTLDIFVREDWAKKERFK